MGLELLSWSLGSTPDLTLRAPGPTFWAFTGADSAFQKKKRALESFGLFGFFPSYLSVRVQGLGLRVNIGLRLAHSLE